METSSEGNSLGITLEHVKEAMQMLGDAPPVPKELKIMVNGYLPEGTIVVSKDVWEALKKETTDGKALPARPEAQL